MKIAAPSRTRLLIGRKDRVPTRRRSPIRGSNAFMRGEGAGAAGFRPSRTNTPVMTVAGRSWERP